MTHVSLTPFGRQPMTAGLLAARALATTPPPALPGTNQFAIDKWSLFNDLRTARMVFGVTDRDLSVLYALLTFLPAKTLAADAELVVFPSNASLSDRAHGMAESTLRRHLAALVGAGLILRQDSPNGKRYAARDRTGGLVQAFGFDLRPLLNRAAEVVDAAEAAHAATLALRRAREDVVLRLRDATKLIAYGREAGLRGDWDAMEVRLLPVRRALRRLMTADGLTEMTGIATIVLEDTQAMLMLDAKEMHGTASHSGRHYSNSNEDSSVSEPCPEQGRALDEGSGALPTIPLYLVLKACPDLEPYARGDLMSWHGFVGTVAYVRGMMGISVSAWDEACRIMGPEAAAVCVAAMLQRVGAITNPGGYLRALSAKAAAGEFSVGPMVMALLNTTGSRAA